MTVVIDASIAVRWYFGAAKVDSSDELVKSQERLIAPDLLIPEFANAAWKAVEFGGASAIAAREAVADIESQIDELIPSVELKDRALAIALELHHPAYDCFYLALAEQRDCQLVTADDRLIRRCGETQFAGILRPL